MSGSTISNTVTTGITLGTLTSGGTYASPLTITATGAVETNSGNAVFGPAGGAWTVENQGTIGASGSGAYQFGIYLAAGGRVDNAGLIEGQPALYIGGAAGTVTNSGTIVGTGTGSQAVGIYAGGSVNNTGLIEGDNAVDIGNAGHGAGTVANFGTIAGTGTHGSGVSLDGGGSVANTDLIEGRKGVQINYALGSVTNSGTILGTTLGVSLSAGGTIVNQGKISATNTYGAGILLAGGGTISNLGTISDNTAGTSGNAGIFLFGASGGKIINGQAGSGLGLITAYHTGIAFLPGTAANPGIVTVVNYGTIQTYGTIQGAQTVAIYTYAGTFNGFAVELDSISAVDNFGTIAGSQTAGGGGVRLTGGLVTNEAGGVINGAGGSAILLGGTTGAAAIVTNSGLLTGSIGVSIDPADTGSNTVVNSGTIVGTGTSGVGINLAAGGTVVDSGTISGAVGAISFGGTGSNLLVLEHGYGALGTVILSASATNTVKLAGSVGSAVTAGAGFTPSGANFQDVLFGAGGYDTAQIKTPTTLASYTFQPTISGFTLTSEIIDMTRLGSATLANGGTVNGSDQLVISNSSQSVTLQLNASDGTVFAAASDGTTGTDITPVCFCRGTRILTERGEVAVEELAVGDRVVTLSGAAKPIRWIGMGRDLVTRRNSLARPIVVRAGALADAVPRRDLYLTHGHALYVDGVLIPVEHLVNHRSILWDEAARVVEYYHIELEDHDVLLAEGAPAESYYDAANRAFFQNTREGSEAGVAQPIFAPVLTSGETVERVWAELFARAGGQIEHATTGDPDLHLIVDGERLGPASVAEGVYIFALAAPPAGPLILSSRSAIPSLVGLNRHEHRRLGVAIRQIILQQPGVMTCLDHDAPTLAEGGCHRTENGHSWTDGELSLPPALFAPLRGAFTLMVHTSRQTMRYPVAVTGRARLASRHG